MQTHQFGPYTIRYIERHEWDLIGRQRGVYIGATAFTALVPHHTVTGFVRAYPALVVERMRYLQNLRPDLGQDIPYNWVIFAGATPDEAYVAEGRGLGWTGAHTSGYNSSVHAAAFWGNSITDPVDPAVLEAFRFCGRMMPNAHQETKDHGLYPDQGTACAGDKIRQALPELQPPFNPAGGSGIPATTKEHTVYSFELRPTGAFDWPGMGSVVSFDSGVVRDKDEITVELTGKNQNTRNVLVIHPNGKQEVKAAQWGLPAKFVADGSGWTAVLVGSDAASGVVRVRGRA